MHSLDYHPIPPWVIVAIRGSGPIARIRHSESGRTCVYHGRRVAVANAASMGVGMSGLQERFGRTLRLGIVGGGPESWIGRMHRGAAEMDGKWRAVAGVFSAIRRAPASQASQWGSTPARSYGDVAEMLAREREREDGIDAVAIMTPNDTHYPFARRSARREARCRLRQAGHAGSSRGVRSRRTRAPAPAPVRDRARVLGVSDDALRPNARRADGTLGAHPARAGRVHSERTRDSPRGGPASTTACAGCSIRSGAVSLS